MASIKRKSNNEGDDRNPEIPEQQSKRRHGDSELHMPIRFDYGNLRIVPTFKEFASCFEVLLRKVTREEVPRYLLSSSDIHDHIGTSGAKPIYELRFANKVACTIFTRSQIKSDDEDKFIQIELVDAVTQSVITLGHLASIKIKLCVLKGDFGSKDWTADQFHDNILPPREGREALLKGETLITLHNGVATITNLELTDNSRWTRSAKFRLGAKVAESTSHEENIREGISEPFRVKESRGKNRQKHKRPSSKSVAGQEAGQCSGTHQGLQLNFPTAHQDQLEALPPDLGQPFTSICSTTYNQLIADSPPAELGGLIPERGYAWG